MNIFNFYIFRKESEDEFKRMKGKETQLMVSNYLDALTDSVCSENF